MRIALPTWRQRISPVLDTATLFRFVDVEGGCQTAWQELPWNGTEHVGRVQFLMGFGTDIVICCAVSRRLQVEIEACGIHVLAHTCGPVDDVVAAYLQNRLTDEVFRMPGCRRLPDCTERKIRVVECADTTQVGLAERRKIAFTADGPNLDAPLARYFGKCAYFVVIDPDTGACEVHANVGGRAGETKRRSDIASRMARMGVHTLVSRTIGPRVRAELESARVQVVTGAWPTVRSAIDAGAPEHRD